MKEVDFVGDEYFETAWSIGSNASEQRRITMSILQFDQRRLVLVHEHLTELQEHFAEHFIIIRDGMNQGGSTLLIGDVQVSLEFGVHFKKG